MRYQLIVLLLFPVMIFAQQPQPPAVYGGSSLKTLNLREGVEGSIRTQPTPDFEKFNDRYRSMLPQKRKCSTLELEKDRQAKNNSETLDEFEEWLQQGMQRDRGMRRKSIGESDILTLPVVFHIIYANPTENISQEQIMSQLRILNQDYRRRNPDASQTDPKFKKVASDPGIEFCLAKVDPNGNPTSGVERISLGGSPFSDRYINDVIKPTTIWDPTRYMNIWVCNIAGGILGYAQFPSSSGLTGIPTSPGAENTDGVVIHYNAFGTTGTAVSPFNRGRTATHEIGHWLGLRHVWGDGPCEVDDFCRDTPPTSKATYNCPSALQGCFGAAMLQNFMDYTNDGCMNLFTFDQRQRMRNVLQNSPRRVELLDSDVCQVNAEPPVADFKADIQLGGAPLLVNFSDLSEGDVVSYRWNFPGGEPAASTLANPQVSYAQPGLYTVSLTVTNTANLTDNKQLDAFVWVADQGATLPFALDFESDNFPPGGTLMYDPFEEGTWKHTARTGGFGSSGGAMYFNNYDNKIKGDVDWLLTRYLDFSETQKPVLRFDVAYAKYSGLYADTLGVFISTGGSEVFEAVYFRGGDDLATSQDYLRGFSPFPEEWRTEYIDLSKFTGEKLVQVAFVNLSDYGNNLFVDNIFVGEKPKTAPKPSFSADFTTICEGDEVSFSNSTEGDNNRYRWSFAGGTPATDTSDSPTVQYLKPGLYEVTLTVSNDGGSESKTRQGYIKVDPSPQPFSEKDNYRICPGQTATLMAVGEDEYSWYNADESEELIAGPRLGVSPKASTAYTLLAINEFDCDASKVVEVIVEEIDNIVVSPAEASVCKGQGVVLRAEGDATFNWAPGASLSREEGPAVTASPKQTTTYVMTAESPGGCKVRREVTVNVIDAPTVYAAAEKKTICQGESVRIRAAGSGPFSWTANGTATELASDIINVSPLMTTTYEVSAGSVGCKSTASVKVEVKEKAVMAPDQDSYVLCPGGQTNLRINGASEVQWLTAPGFINASGAEARVGPAQDQEYRAVATDDNGCSDTLSVLATLAKTNDIIIKNSSPTLCPGMFSELSAEGAASYSWSPQLGLSSTSGEKVVARPPSTTTYFLTATDEYGCVSRARTTVTVGSGTYPQADFTLQRKRICAGETVRFVDKSQGATSFSWEFPGSNTPFSNEQNPKVTYDRPGVYDVLLRVEGCIGNDFMERRGYVSVGRPSDLSINESFITLCKGDSVLLSASGALEYNWEPAIGLSSTNAKAVWAYPKKDQLYTVSGIDQYGCEANAEVQVVVQGTGGKAGISSVTTDICEGETAKLTASGADRYAWFDENGAMLGQGAEFSFQPERDITVRLEARQEGGCASQDRASIRVKPAPSISLEATKNSICAGESIILTADGALEYQWEPSPGLIPDGKQATVAPLNDRTFRVSAEDGLGCRTTKSIDIDVQTGKDLLLRSFDTTLCPGDLTIITALGGNNYSWSPTTGLDTAGGSVVVASPARTTKYVVTSASEEGCPAVATITVKVFEANNFRIFPPKAERCAGDTVTLRAEGANNIQWAAGPGLRATQEPEVTLRPSETATYRASGIDENGCEVEGVATINLRKMDSVDLQASAASVCLGESVELEAKGGNSFTWIDAPGLERPRGARITAIPQEKTTYAVVVSNELGCSDTASIEVNVQTLDANYLVSKNNIDLAKEEGLISFQDKTEGAVEWLWDFGDGGESTEAFTRHFYDKPGVYEVAMAVTDGVCIDEAPTTITVINSSSLAELEDADALEVKSSSSEKGHVNLLINSDRPMRLRYRVLDGFGTALLNDHIRFDAQPYEKTLDLSEFGSGSYLIQLSDGEETWEEKVDF